MSTQNSCKSCQNVFCWFATAWLEKERDPRLRCSGHSVWISFTCSSHPDRHHVASHTWQENNAVTVFVILHAGCYSTYMIFLHPLKWQNCKNMKHLLCISLELILLIKWQWRILMCPLPRFFCHLNHEYLSFNLAIRKPRFKENQSFSPLTLFASALTSTILFIWSKSRYFLNVSWLVPYLHVLNVNTNDAESW